MNIFLHHRDLRYQDNTTMIKQQKAEGNITPIFIFEPLQIDPKKNDYFSNNSVQFMIESLRDLNEQIKEKGGELYYFHGDTLKVIKKIHQEVGINSIGFNYDYTPFAKKRDESIKAYCKKNNIKVYCEEDFLLYNIIDKQYLVFTPFKKYCMTNLKVREVDKFRSFDFKKSNKLKEIKYNIPEKELNNYYVDNPTINVHGGRKEGLKILSKADNFKTYQKDRDTLTYKTTFLAAHNHFMTVSIRETYHAFQKNSGIISELHWREFYTNIIHNHPKVLDGQIRGKNKSFREKYDNIKWSYNKTLFDKFCKGETGFPIIDAGIRQLLKHGYVHNRVRMVHGNFLTKDLHLDWRMGEQFYAQNLVDYDPVQNNQGWQWCSGSGTDSQPYFRIFNPWTQTKDYDPDLEYVRKFIPELKDVPNKDILNWWKPDVHEKWLKEGVKYFKPIVEHDVERKETLKIYKAGLN
jgi:deoxyribodipyrimidine photo-lyase